MDKSLEGISSNYFIVGKIHTAHGLRGDVSVQVLTDRLDRFDVGKQLWSLADEKPYPLIIETVRESDRGLIIRFQGVSSRDDAEKLTGSDIGVSLEDRGTAESGSYYVSDLIDCQVVTDDGWELGHLVEVVSQPHHDLYIVQGQSSEIIIPVIQEFIQEIDIEHRRIVVRELEAFWDGGNDD